MRALLFGLFLHDFLYDLAIIQLDYYDVKSCWLRGETNRDAFTHIDCVEDTYFFITGRTPNGISRALLSDVKYASLPEVDSV